MKHRADLSVFGICDASDYTTITPSFLGCSTFRDLSRMPQPGSGNQSHTEVRKSSNLKPVTLLALDLIPGGIRGTFKRGEDPSHQGYATSPHSQDKDRET